METSGYCSEAGAFCYSNRMDVSVASSMTASKAPLCQAALDAARRRTVSSISSDPEKPAERRCCLSACVCCWRERRTRSALLHSVLPVICLVSVVFSVVLLFRLLEHDRRLSRLEAAVASMHPQLPLGLHAKTVEAYCVGGTTEGQACQTCDSLNTTEPMCCKYGFCFAIGTKLVSTNCVKYCECTRKKEGKPLKWKCGKIKGKHALKDDCPACAIDSAASAACDSVRFLETCGLLDCLSAAHKKFCGKGVPTCEGPAFPNAEAVLAPKDHKAVTTSCSALC